MTNTINLSGLDYRQFIEENIYSIDIGHRGGTLKIDVSSLFPEITDEQPIMGASQNYLGGGMLGAISTGAMFNRLDLTEAHQEQYKALAEACKAYMHEYSNHSDDEWESSTLEENQKRPVSAY